MKKVLSFMLFITVLFGACFNTAALDSYYAKAEYSYKTYEVSKYVYDSDKNFLGIIQIQFKFRYNENMDSAKCLAVNHNVVSEAQGVNMEISHEIQNLTTNKGGAVAEIRFRNPKDLSKENIKIFATLDCRGHGKVTTRCTKNVKLV